MIFKTTFKLWLINWTSYKIFQPTNSYFVCCHKLTTNFNKKINTIKNQQIHQQTRSPKFQKISNCGKLPLVQLPSSFLAGFPPAVAVIFLSCRSKQPSRKSLAAWKTTMETWLVRGERPASNASASLEVPLTNLCRQIIIYGCYYKQNKN